MDVAVSIAAFKEHLAARGYAAATITSYGKGLDQFTRYLEGRNINDLRRITRTILAEYREEIMVEPIAIESKALKIRPVKRFFEHLAINHHLLINPTEGLIETCRRHRKIGSTLTIEEMKRFLAQPDLTTTTGLRNRTVLELFYATGIRLNELIHMEVNDIDLTENLLIVRRGKGGADRTVPLGNSAGVILKQYLAEIRPRLVRDPGVTALFVNRNGTPLTTGAIRFFLARYRKMAGLDKPVSPHVFRRSCATHLLQRGADIRYIQELLGHQRLITTQVYTKVMPAEVKRTHEKTHPGVAEDRRQRTERHENQGADR